MKTNDYKTCYECGGAMLPHTTEKLFRVGSRVLKTGGLKMYICPNCGEEVFAAKEICSIDKLARNVGCFI